MSEQELKPCPFCGSENVESDSGRAFRALVGGKLGKAAAIQCCDCDAEMMRCYADMPDVPRDDVMADLIATWNLRALSPAGGGEWAEKARQMIVELRDYVVNERDAQVLPRKRAGYQRELDEIDALLAASPQPEPGATINVNEIDSKSIADHSGQTPTGAGGDGYALDAARPLAEVIHPEWTLDCQGKQDYDADLLRLSCRYYPRGGGFSALNSGQWQENDARPEIKPSAIAHILWGEAQIVTANFEGEDEGEVKAKVEAWAADQIEAIRATLTATSAGTKGDDSARLDWVLSRIPDTVLLFHGAAVDEGWPDKSPSRKGIDAARRARGEGNG